jgi:hypothetical protein
MVFSSFGFVLLTSVLPLASPLNPNLSNRAIITRRFPCLLNLFQHLVDFITLPAGITPHAGNMKP